jgi:hypothetical protein
MKPIPIRSENGDLERRHPVSGEATIAPTGTRFFAVFADGQWAVVNQLEPDLENFGPFASPDEADAEINSPYADNDLPLYHPTAAEYAQMRNARYLRLIEALAAS